jgi:SpoVK/Ycf46/Vps4 family AAA+-type ATPase
MLLTPKKLDPQTGLAHWSRVEDVRHPWARQEVQDELRAWIRESENADKLTEAGEKVMPLLLSGESRCGKTSTLCWLAHSYFGVPAFRASIGSMIGQFMGETTKAFRDAICEAMSGPAGLYILDEVDGIFQQRVSGGPGGATQEMNAAIATALALVESLPQHLMLAATTNEPKIIDRAMVARFTHVAFPSWAELKDGERRAFAKSHQLEAAWGAKSYAEAVQLARRERVRRILSEPEKATG